MNTKRPIYTLHFTNFPDKECVQMTSFTALVNHAKSRGWEAHITDGMGEVIATWSPIHDLRMKPNKYSA